MANEKIIQICDWETVEQKTRTGTMADLVIDSILKRMWTEKKGQSFFVGSFFWSTIWST